MYKNRNLTGGREWEWDFEGVGAQGLFAEGGIWDGGDYFQESEDEPTPPPIFQPNEIQPTPAATTNLGDILVFDSIASRGSVHVHYVSAVANMDHINNPSQLPAGAGPGLEALEPSVTAASVAEDISLTSTSAGRVGRAQQAAQAIDAANFNMQNAANNPRKSDLVNQIESTQTMLLSLAQGLLP